MKEKTLYRTCMDFGRCLDYLLFSLTFSPSTANCPLALRLAKRYKNESIKPDDLILTLPSLAMRQDFLNENPAASTQLLNRLVTNFLKICGLPLDEFKGRRTGTLHFD